jgi:hypothetical protein
MATIVRNREEVVNTQLAIFISRLGVTANAETIEAGGGHRPDVLFLLRGLRVVIEGKFDDVSGALQQVERDALNRVRAGIGHIAVAVVYPIALRTTPTNDLLRALERSALRYKIISEGSANEEWFEGTAANLMDTLRRAQELLASNDLVEETADALSERLGLIGNLWVGHTGTLERLSAMLGTPVPDGETETDANERRHSAAKVSALILANALIFQEQLSATDERVRTLRSLVTERDVVSATAGHWRWIWENINYVPIFQLAERVLNELPSGASASSALDALIREAVDICSRQAALRHDLMGRIYHFLLHDAKYLGTYYTSVPAATLLLKLVIGLPWSCNFSSTTDLTGFKAIDLSCGTGTLLMAAAQAISDRFIMDRARLGDQIDQRSLSTLHSTLMQNVLHGYDILPTAVHLTASTLALLAPEIAFRQMNLFVMPIGMDGSNARLGSIDFLGGQTINTQFSLHEDAVEVQRTGAGRTSYGNADLPNADLFVMNPPFVSNRYGNLMFGSLPAERPRLKRKLQEWARRFGVQTTAGLGAMFVPLADLYVKPGGRIAFVLPLALATGEAWEPIRRLIADRYDLEYVIASHDSARYNFSENTSLSEIMFVARRLAPGERPCETAFISLWKNPTTIYEALDSAHCVEDTVGRMRTANTESSIVLSAGRPVAEIALRPSPRGGANWTPIMFAQSTLSKVHDSLENSRAIVDLATGAATPVPMTRLHNLGELGFDARDVADAFEVDRQRSNWSAFEGFFDHDATVVTTIEQQPNAYVHPRTEALEGRPLRSPERVWSMASDIMLVSRLRTNTQKVIAIGLDTPVIGNTWWTFKHDLTDNRRKSLLLWFNSTLGILLYYGRRAVTEGAWVQMKKPAWTGMPVLDVASLSDATLEMLAAQYDALATRTLQPVADLATDAVRRAVDQALTVALELPDLSLLRDLFQREPSFSGSPLV